LRSRDLRRARRYISSIQQIVFDAFEAAAGIGIVFGADRRADGARVMDQCRVVGGSAAGGSDMAARWPSRRTRFIALVAGRHESLWTFIVLQALTMVCFSFASSNLGTWRWTDGADRRNGILGPGSGRHDRRGYHRIRDRAGFRRDRSAVPVGNGGLRGRRPGLDNSYEPKRLFAGPSAVGAQLEPHAAAKA
jgi:hypothetical protein